MQEQETEKERHLDRGEVVEPARGCGPGYPPHVSGDHSPLSFSRASRSSCTKVSDQRMFVKYRQM